MTFYNDDDYDEDDDYEEDDEDESSSRRLSGAINPFSGSGSGSGGGLPGSSGSRFGGSSGSGGSSPFGGSGSSGSRFGGGSSGSGGSSGDSGSRFGGSGSSGSGGSSSDSGSRFGGGGSGSSGSSGSGGSSPFGGSGSSGSRFGGGGSSGSSGSSSDSGSRFGGGGSGSSGSSGSGGSSPFGGSGSSGSRFGGGGSSGSSSSTGDTGRLGGGGSSGDSGSRFGGSGSSGSGGSGSGSSGSRFGGGGSSGSSGSSGDSGSRFGGGSSGSSGGTSSDSGSRFGGGSGSGNTSASGGGTSSDSGSRFGGGSGSSFGGGNRPSTTTSTGNFPTVKPDDKKDDKKDDKSGDKKDEGAKPNIFGRFGAGGDKKDDKPADKKDEKKDEGAKVSPFGRFGAGGDKKDDKPADKKDEKKDDKSKDASGDKKGGVGGFLNRGKKEDEVKKPADTKKADDKKGDDGAKKGALGGIAGRLPFGKKADDKPAETKKPDDKKGDAKKTDDKTATGTTKQSPLGATKTGVGATKTDAGKTPTNGGKGKAAIATTETGGILGKIRSRIPFLAQSADAKKAPASKTRANKVPQPVNEGLSLDQKLDILGVALMFSAVAIFFSSLSGQQGSLTGTINNFFAQLVGQGAVVVPLVFGAAGFWLIIRHFGEEAPRIDPVRITGLVILFICSLMLLMFIETFNYTNATRETFPLYIEQSIAQGRGGGQIGAYLYNLLVVNLGELPAVVFIFGLVVVGVMVLTRTSAAELTVYTISIWRSLRVAGQRRAQKRNAMRTALLEARAKEQAEREKNKPVITAPKPAELTPVTVAGALPDTTQTEAPRAIPIRMGNQTVTAEVDAEGNITTKPVTAPVPTPVAESTAQTIQKGDEGGNKPRFALPFANRGKQNDATTNGKPAEQPVTEKKAETPAPTPTPEKTGRFGIFNRNTTQTPTPTTAPEDVILPKPVSTTPVATTTTPSIPTPPPTTDVLPKPIPTPMAKATTTTGEIGALKSPTSTFIDDDADDEVDETPKRIPLTPMGETVTTTPVSRFGAQTTSTTPPPTTEQPPRFGGASTGGDNPFGKPTTSTGTPSSPFGGFKPAPKPVIDDDDDDSDDDSDDEVTTTPFKVDDDIFARLESNTPANMPSTTPTTSTTPPPSIFEKPTSPFGGGSTTSPFASTSSPKPPLSVSDEDDDEDENEKPIDRTSRLDQIRTGVNKPNLFTRPTTPPSIVSDEDADDDEDYDEDDYDEDEDELPSSSRKPMTNPFGDTKPSPFGATSTPKPTIGGYGKPEDKAGDMTDVTRSPSFVPPTFAASTPPKQTEVPQATTLKPPVNENKPLPFSGSGATVERPTSTFTSSVAKKVWRLPDYRTLLASGSEGDIDREQLVRRAKVIEETLSSFGAPGRVVEINTGPVITQFGVEPDYLIVRGGKKVRVKVGQIAQLDKDIQLALGAKSIRIEAPVPGKGYVGIEVPNEEAALVSLRDVMESKQFNKLGEKSPLTIALGQSVDGAPISADLASMPHLLIAGTTGSGKSVCVNAIIASLLVRNTPDKVKFIMVDPKRVELTGYNGIPHLIAPVVVELERIVGVLKWVTREMDDRYKKFSNAGARNIEDYNQHLMEGEPLPYIVVIIDELADLMMLAPDETERVITRIAALARATGIHLVIATQRPSVDVVTGLIKANFPARIAFAVAGGVDSRVILDQPGAERLLGRGDMLYMSGDSPAPLRLQGVYVSDMEINNINRFWRTQQPDSAPTKTVSALVGDEPPTQLQKPSIPINKVEDKPKPTATSTHSSVPSFWDDEESLSDKPSGNGNGSRDENAHEDELYEEAVEMVRRLNKASVSLLQRRLRIGYTRAARLIDIMEAQGVVGPAVEGSKPREVLPPKK